LGTGRGEARLMARSTAASYAAWPLDFFNVALNTSPPGSSTTSKRASGLPSMLGGKTTRLLTAAWIRARPPVSGARAPRPPPSAYAPLPSSPLLPCVALRQRDAPRPSAPPLPCVTSPVRRVFPRLRCVFAPPRHVFAPPRRVSAHPRLCVALPPVAVFPTRLFSVPPCARLRRVSVPRGARLLPALSACAAFP